MAMMTKTKRLLAAMGTVGLLASSVACSTPESTQTGSGTQEADANKPLDLTIMAVLHTPDIPSGPVISEIEKKTNTNLKVNWVPQGVYEEKVNAGMATETLPQAVFVGNVAIYNKFKSSLRDGQFWEIGPYLKDYPYLSNLDPVVLKNSAIDGKIYGLYQSTPLSRQGVIYRKDWADKLGLPEPKTTEDLYQMMKAFKEKDPDGDGQDNTIGVGDRSDLVYGAFKTISSYFGTPNYWGEKDGKLQPEFMFPQYIDTMNFFKKLSSEGLINRDFPVTSKSDHEALFKSGKAGVYVGCLCAAPGYQRDMRKTNPNVELAVVNRITGPDGKEGVWSVPGYGNMVLFPKSAVKDEAELKRILAYFNHVMSPEIYNLLTHGIEGKHYDLVDGKAKGYRDAENVAIKDREVRPLLSLRIGGEETIDGLKAYVDDPLQEKTNAAMADNNNILINNPASAYSSPTEDHKGLQLQQIITDATYQYILGKMDESGFQAAVEKWKSEGGDKVIEEYNEQHAKFK
ncbi:extracellular solute-binding protein [Paenibacillus turpanensis]|uniref:extracellular solute-binding protein n=1 Tax=Paenibacillus turpanensis TaxID=2689078 RepID=UPI001FB6E2E1|nr:extracellular solute-binding protein [Paenibacillus turpanensis]